MPSRVSSCRSKSASNCSIALPHYAAAASAQAVTCDVHSPQREDVARCSSEKIQSIGFSRQKAHALFSLAQAITRNELNLEALARDDDTVIRQRLLELPGVGRWTAEYVLLRGLGRLNVFPGDDVGAQNGLARWLGRSRRPDYAGVSRAVKRWSPFAGVVYLHLLLDGLSRSGVLEPEARR